MTPHFPIAAQGRLRRAGAVAALSIALAACSSSDMTPDPTVGWLAASSPKALEVDHAEYRHRIYFATDRDQIAPGEQDRLLAFLDAVRPKRGEGIRIEGHADERASDLYNLDLSSRRVGAVRRFLQDRGLSAAGLSSSAFGERAPAAPGHDPEALRQNRRVELVVDRYLVTPPACPDWSRRSGLDYANQPHSNLGCATQTNLGLMIAEPKDLVRGRRLDGADGAQQAAGMDRYRDGKVTELQEERVE
jgi:pilus biogenesis lipoprotein CpaD